MVRAVVLDLIAEVLNHLGAVLALLMGQVLVFAFRMLCFKSVSDSILEVLLLFLCRLFVKFQI